MREKVCIVLNEREPAKLKAAEALAARLKDYNITASRLDIGPNIEKVVFERRPQVLVLDYLLGDVTTGLDVLSLLQSLRYEERPKTIFLTDEPSVQVAVDAMRLGAVHYFEIDNPQSVNHTAREAYQILKNERTPRKFVEKKSIPTLDDFIAHAKPSLELVSRARAIALKGSPIVMIIGNRGSGRTMLAQALHQERKANIFFSSIDLGLYDGAIADIGGRLCTSDGDVVLGHNQALIVDNPEEDDGEFLSLIADKFGALWTNATAKKNGAFLTLCTSSREIARAWKKLVPVEELIIPPLSERRQDIPPLVQRFVRESEEASDEKIKPFSAEIVTWLASLDWPGDVAQLRSVVVDAALGTMTSDLSIKELIERNIELWNECQAVEKSLPPPDAMTAAFALEKCNFNWRVTAAKLGCSVNDLRKLLHPEG